MNKLFRIYLDEFDRQASYFTDEIVSGIENGSLKKVSTDCINAINALAPLHRNALISRAMRMAGIRGTEKYTVKMLEEKVFKTEFVESLSDIINVIQARVSDFWLSALDETEIHAIAKSYARHEFSKNSWPSNEKFKLTEITSEQKRASDIAHQKRSLRRRASTARQALSALLATVGHKTTAYADAFTLACWRERQESARAYGQNRLLTWTDATGKTKSVSLFDVIETSRKSRFATLYAQTVGLDELTVRRDLIPIFITITLPPQYHANPQFGQPFGGNGIEDCPLPTETDQALASLWVRFRARASARKINLLGLRVIEAHQDGCPHLHALLYVKRDQVQTLDGFLTALRPEPVPGLRVATKLEILDRARGKPASYVIKYLIKTLPAREQANKLADGTCDENGDPDHLAHHDEVRAWASERRLRQFAWIGIHGLRAPWQRLHQADEAELEQAPSSIKEAHSALRNGQWGDALEALGAIKSDKKVRPKISYVESKNRYGEIIKKPFSLTLEDWSIKLKRYTYEIVRVMKDITKQRIHVFKKEEIAGLTVIVSYPSSAVLEDSACKTIERTGPPPALEQNNDAEMQFINI